MPYHLVIKWIPYSWNFSTNIQETIDKEKRLMVFWV
jgi:hypothetical protein